MYGTQKPLTFFISYLSYGEIFSVVLCDNCMASNMTTTREKINVHVVLDFSNLFFPILVLVYFLPWNCGWTKIICPKSFIHDYKYLLSQLEIIVYDSVYPSARDTSTVLISVARDVNGPIFQPSATYQITIPETTAVSRIIIDVNATDPDGVCISVLL